MREEVGLELQTFLVFFWGKNVGGVRLVNTNCGSFWLQDGKEVRNASP